MIILESIQIGAAAVYGDPRSDDPMERQWSTGFFKSPVQGPIRLHELGLEGDGVADPVNHGGRDKAVLGYAMTHYPFWKTVLDRNDLAPGAFGENFSIVGQSEASVFIGDRYRIGDCEVQVSQPRQPCWKLGRRWKIKLLPKLVTQTGFGGWYYRVLKPGIIQAGQELELLERTQPTWSIARANDVLFGRLIDREAMTELLMVPELSQSWKQSLG